MPSWLSVGGIAFVGLMLALVLRPSLRRTVVNKYLFPAGYRVYTSPVGAFIHTQFLMSAAAKPHTPHTKVDSIRSYGSDNERIKVVPIPILEDNYSYLVLHEKSKTAALVDPADPAPILTVLQQQYSDYKLTHILTTHKHWDHAGGNEALVKEMPKLTVVGGVGEGVAAGTVEVTTGDTVKIQNDFSARVYQCPCHTKGHVLFHIGDVLFTGDTLFTGGCGKFFEGNAEQMYDNLYKTIGKVPESTVIFPGHEYTVSNLEFAKWVEPENSAIAEKFAWASERRAGKFPTIPSTLKEEREYNPFLRVHVPSVRERVQRVAQLTSSGSSADESQRNIQVMDALRSLKNANAHK